MPSKVSAVPDRSKMKRSASSWKPSTRTVTAKSPSPSYSKFSKNLSMEDDRY
jgi:hypothetical protein